MKLILTILMAILMAYQAAATVESPGMISGNPGMINGNPGMTSVAPTGAIWPPSVPSPHITSLPYKSRIPHRFSRFDWPEIRRRQRIHSPRKAS